MADLIATSPFDGLLPMEIGGTVVTDMSIEAITSVAPFKGREPAVSAALQAQIGAAFPKPGRSTGNAEARAVWAGLGQCFVLGPRPAPITGAAMTDQTDAWACFTIDGPNARDVLARLVPADLRPEIFAVGHAMRSTLGHMNAVILRSDTDRYDVMVFRSMAHTAVHELETTLHAVAARAAQ